jgi:hypothetical protein
MPSYRWNNLRFELPDGLQDESVLTFVDDSDAPKVSVTVAREPAVDVASYVTEVKQELKEIMAGIKVRGEAKTDVGGVKATRLDIDIPTEDGPRRQAQLYIPGKGEVIVITATAAVPEFLKAEAALMSVTSGFAQE